MSAAVHQEVVKIEQHLQETPQFFIFPADEAIALGIPIFLGLATRNAVPGFIAGVCLYLLWKRVKGERGVPGVLSMIYWWLPKSFSRLNALPDSSVGIWRA